MEFCIGEYIKEFSSWNEAEAVRCKLQQTGEKYAFSEKKIGWGDLPDYWVVGASGASGERNRVYTTFGELK